MLTPAQRAWIRACEYNIETRRWENTRWGRGVVRTVRVLSGCVPNRCPQLVDFALGLDLAWLTPAGIEVRMHLLEDELSSYQ